MKPTEYIADLLARAGRLPTNTVVIVYASAGEARTPDDPPLDADQFNLAQSEGRELAGELTRQGVVVYGIQFDRSAYNQWRWRMRRPDEPDSHTLRNEWAAYTCTRPGTVWSIQMGKQSFGEAVRSVRVASWPTVFDLELMDWKTHPQPVES